MSGIKVAIIGAGRLGSLLAARIPSGCRKVIISRNKERATHLADEVGGIASDRYSAVRGCQTIFLVVPGSAVAAVVQALAPHVSEGALLVNMATDLMTEELMDAFPNLRFAAAKVIGHSREMSLGSKGAVVIDHIDGPDEERLRWLVSGLGPAMKADEGKVLAANSAMVEVLAGAEATLRYRLSEVGLDGDLIQAALTGAAPGVLRAIAEGDLGPFARGVLERLESSRTAP